MMCIILLAYHSLLLRGGYYGHPSKFEVFLSYLIYGSLFLIWIITKIDEKVKHFKKQRRLRQEAKAYKKQLVNGGYDENDADKQVQYVYGMM